MPEIRFRQAARADLQAAAEWYESQRPGLYEEFAAAIERSLAHLRLFPDQGVMFHGAVRRKRVDQFPFALYYLHERGAVWILAISHQRLGSRRVIALLRRP